MQIYRSSELSGAPDSPVGVSRVTSGRVVGSRIIVDGTIRMPESTSRILGVYTAEEYAQRERDRQAARAKVGASSNELQDQGCAATISKMSSTTSPASKNESDRSSDQDLVGQRDSGNRDQQKHEDVHKTTAAYSDLDEG